jgi:hypothetical protein
MSSYMEHFDERLYGAEEDLKREVEAIIAEFAVSLDVPGHPAILSGEPLDVEAEHLRSYPFTITPRVESFVYWSKERLVRKAIISVTHVSIVRGQPGRSNCLVYVNRSEVDVLHGTFGGTIGWFMQRRLKAEAANALQGLRRRLENGEPPPAIVTGSP